MQIALHQFYQNIKQTLRPIYLLWGDELLLRQEARDAIRNSAHTAGYVEHQRLEVESGFHWQQLITLSNSYSLFAEKTIIEVHNPTAKFDTEAGKTIITYCQMLPSDKLLVIISAKLTPAQQKTVWYKAIDENGIIVPIWPVKPNELFQWIQNRLHLAKIKADATSIRWLAELTEGNLLATQQAIIKLQLLYPDKPIGIKEMASVVSDNAQFNVFELSKQLLSGNRRNLIRILQQLRASGVEPTLVLWLLARECRQLGNKKLLLACQETDQIIKGVTPGDPWNALTRISLDFAGQKS